MAHPYDAEDDDLDLDFQDIQNGKLDPQTQIPDAPAAPKQPSDFTGNGVSSRS